MATSTIPAAIDWLVAAFSAAVPDATVTDGQPINMADDLIMVAFTGEPGAPAVQVTRDRESMSGVPEREQYEITCMVSAWKGVMDDVKTVRDRAFELVDAMAAELRTDQTLGGIALSARLSVANIAAYFTTDGVSVDVQVTVEVDAFTGAS